MFGWYTLFKFLHVASVTIWVGGVATVVVLNARLTAERDPAASRLLWKQSTVVGQTLIGPAAGVTLLAGFAMIGVTGWHMPLWVWLGLGTVFASMALGAVFIRKAAEAYAAASASDPIVPEVVAAARQRLTRLNAINVALLLFAVAAMVFKPTL